MSRFELRVSQPEKDAWIEQALRDGFRELGPWMRWLANTRVKEQRQKG